VVSGLAAAPVAAIIIKGACTSRKARKIQVRLAPSTRPARNSPWATQAGVVAFSLSIKAMPDAGAPSTAAQQPGPIAPTSSVESDCHKPWRVNV